MLRVNLATRPFYNERGVYLLLAGIGFTLLGVTALNVSSLSYLTAREGELRARISKEETRAQELRREATRLRGSVRQDELEAVLAAAREANGLIDRRTFSWTSLFNYLETTLPADVMLTAVRPSVENGEVTLTMIVIGREVDAIDAFMERLEETGAFRGLLSRDERARDDGTYEAALVGRYVPGAQLPNREVAPETATPAAAAPERGAGP